MSKIVFEAENVSIEQKQKFINDFSEDQIVFISKSTKADIKASFYFHGRKMRVCFIGITAIVQVLAKLYPNKYATEKLTIETEIEIFEIDMLISSFSKKEYNIMNHTKKSHNREIHYWKHSVPNYDGYSSNQILMEVPGAALLPVKSLVSQNILNSMLVHYKELNEFLDETLNKINAPKYRMHVKFENNTFNEMFLTMYIQDLERGQMIRLEYFATYEHQLALA